MMASQGRIGIDREKDMLRIESERKLVDSETTENREAREMGAEWCCYLPEGKETDASSGVYYLRTSRMSLSEEGVREYYNIICNVEDTFRT
jgi:hypothetical protein